MDAYLDAPITTKKSGRDGNSQLMVGHCSMQGYRKKMEDEDIALLWMPKDPNAAYFGVFDGHGGTEVAEYLCNNLHTNITKQHCYPDDIVAAITKAFAETDIELKHFEMYEYIGSTAVICLIKGSKIYCANVGDSRMVSYGHGRMEQLSIDHLPTKKIEKERIVGAGGFVTENRVNGILSISRAFGDFSLKKNNLLSSKKQIVSSFPDLTIKEITPNCEFGVIASDGIFEVLTNQDVIEFCRSRILKEQHLDNICEQLVDYCLRCKSEEKGTGFDNMSVVIILFLNGVAYEHKILRMISGSSQSI